MSVCHDAGVDDAIARYRAATEAKDLDGIMATLAPDAELVSPISGRMVFRGIDDLRVLLAAVYISSLRGLRWEAESGDGQLRVVIGQGKLGPFTVGDAMVFELDDLGMIRRIRPHLRPWLALTAFAFALGAQLAPHPGVIRRALRAG